VCAGIAGIVLIFVASPGLRKSTGSALASDD
jgi:hypothetical protein